MLLSGEPDMTFGPHETAAPFPEESFQLPAANAQLRFLRKGQCHGGYLRIGGIRP
ncbi:hypothetical protein D3C86_2247650 [compost metagenome]